MVPRLSRRSITSGWFPHRHDRRARYSAPDQGPRERQPGARVARPRLTDKTQEIAALRLRARASGAWVTRRARPDAGRARSSWTASTARSTGVRGAVQTSSSASSTRQGPEEEKYLCALRLESPRISLAHRSFRLFSNSLLGMLPDSKAGHVLLVDSYRIAEIWSRVQSRIDHQAGRNLVEYAAVLSALLVLSHPEWAPKTMLLGLWQLQGREVPTKSTMRRATDALTACAQSRDAFAACENACGELLGNLTRAVLLRDCSAPPLSRALPRVDVADGATDARYRNADRASGTGTAVRDAARLADPTKKRTLQPDGIFEISPAGDVDFHEALAASPRVIALFAAQLDDCRALVAGKKHDDDAHAKDRHAQGASVVSRVAAMRSDLDSRLNDIRPSLRASTRLNT